jgi:hypothetical protein
VIVRLDRRDLVWINVTTNPTSDWIARQIAEAFPWVMPQNTSYVIGNRIYGAVVTRRLRAMGIRDKSTAAALPLAKWLCRTADRIDPPRVPGSCHRFGEAHLRRTLRSYVCYYNDIRTHRLLDKDALVSRPVQRTGIISSHAILGGLHHHHNRI